ncbi:MAG: hypothetical protein JNM07_11845 [Phycisphaerae bacterium]|nr:hypothetical protein [Phycisphaerae bacterium]
MNYRTTLLVLTSACGLLAGCLGRGGGERVERRGELELARPEPMMPRVDVNADPSRTPPLPPVRVASDGSAAARGVAYATIIDTRTFPNQVQDVGPGGGPVRRVKEVLPPHQKPGPVPAGEPNDLRAGGLLDAEPVRTGAAGARGRDAMYPGIGQTGWYPPDPTLAVGPNHIVTTVNMAIAFYRKDGVLQFITDLSNAGNPGFFEDIGAGGFTFDPKCFYDSYAQRFVVVAPEVYGSTEAWITIAVSDDSDPNGVWYKYRTWAVLTDGVTTFWWDYPGFGYDHQGYYVTSNLFGLNQSGWGGVGYRVFDKTPMLTGQPVVFSTLRDGGSASAQVSQAVGSPQPQAPFIVSLASQTRVRVQSIRDPLTNPTLVTFDVAVPRWEGSFGAPSDGGTIDTLDNRMINAQWRSGVLYCAHGISTTLTDGAKNYGRWYRIRTLNWPTSGAPLFSQAGNVEGGAGVHTFFPAVYANRFDELGAVVGHSAATGKMSVGVTGRLATDAPGTMRPLVTTRVSGVSGSGRIGDYYDMAVDPVDDTRFWTVAQTFESYGWQTWISSFTVSATAAPVPIDDSAAGYNHQPMRIDVMANDFDTQAGVPFTISSFDAASVHGGTVARSVGTGPGGRDEILFTPNAGYAGTDTFRYAISNASGVNAWASVTVALEDASIYRDPDPAPGATAGVDAAYYIVTNASQLPNFYARQPYTREVLPLINYGASTGVFAGSGRSDNLGAVFQGYVEVPDIAEYTFYVKSDDGSRLLIGGQTVVDNDGVHVFVEKSGTIKLKAGKHAVRVEFFEKTAAAGLIVSISGGGLSKQVIPATRWFHLNCPSDFNGDTTVDDFDYFDFLNAFNTGGPGADFNGDTAVDDFDYFEFLNAFEAGC